MFDLRVRLGAVLHIDAADRYRPTDGPMTLRVTGVRLVLNRPEREQWIWVEGTKVNPRHQRGERTQVLVPTRLLASKGEVR
ncbi:hypothetical protein ACFFMR_30835 [Micromonospora andamanensis]|uniref:Uncharacterized protein n=1 Tax=Micromonospora andamanensis TaxID=1287068 RepID=A0ABQ4HR46_9ACTN|nr:hypothetical protein [Micromonospora andamanensis]GIJ08107.1 hypothetical protein Van01_13210 [Micromonospora andamanensis]